MYTVVITEQEHIDSLSEYGLFLEPFMKNNRFAFSRWIPEAESLKEMVPDLEKLIAHREEWRAVILCDEAGIKKKNPFNIIEYKAPVWDEAAETQTEYFARRLEAKKAAYDQAAKTPLARLAAMLCPDPTVTSRGSQDMDQDFKQFLRDGREDDTGELARAEMEFREYRWSVGYKKALRDGIRGDETWKFTYPNEIICIAKRHHEDADYELACAWDSHDEMEYSRFYDWNLYFDKMRYLVVDMEDKAKLNYRSDYICFLLGVILLAGNDVPSGCLQPGRVYRLNCRINEDNLTEILGRYDEKLAATKDLVRGKIAAIRTKPIERLSDAEAEKIFCGSITVSVSMSGNYDRKSLFCDEKFGLSKNHPVDDEERVWTASYMKNRKGLKKLLKQPARAIKVGTDDFHHLKTMEEEQAGVLNEYQVDDVREHVGSEERAMVDTPLNDIYDLDQFYQRIADGAKPVRHQIDRRMRRKAELLWAGAALLMALVGTVPALLLNKADAGALLRIGILLAAALGGIFVAALVCLILFRFILKEEVSRYNGTMGAIVGEVEEDVKNYSIYLSHACNVMRGNSVMEYHHKYANGEEQKIVVLKKHISDMEQRQAMIRDMFGKFVHWDRGKQEQTEEPYDYDFTRAVDYVYPLPEAPLLGTQIEFLEPGYQAEIPYGIVKKLELRREELYD